MPSTLLDRKAFSIPEHIKLAVTTSHHRPLAQSTASMMAVAAPNAASVHPTPSAKHQPHT
jgi:hypothetical protein